MNELEKLLFNLQTIAGIPKGKRISTAKEFIVIDEDSVLQPFIRWRAGDTRDKAAMVICREVRTVIELSQYIRESRYLYEDAGAEDIVVDKCDIAVCAQVQNNRDIRIGELKKIRAALREAYYGVVNLCDTYQNDANVVADLKPLTGEINNCVTDLTKILIDLGEYVDSAFNIC